jgi:hypothetical protein
MGANQSASRAELVETTVRRARIWRLPSQEFGVYKWYPVPDDFGGRPGLGAVHGYGSELLRHPVEFGYRRCLECVGRQRLDLDPLSAF